MKRGNKELDVDFIGGAEPLTKEEEKKISTILESHKTKQKTTSQKQKKKSDRIAAQLPTKCLCQLGMKCNFKVLFYLLSFNNVVQRRASKTQAVININVANCFGQSRDEKDKFKFTDI